MRKSIKIIVLTIVFAVGVFAQTLSPQMQAEIDKFNEYAKTAHSGFFFLDAVKDVFYIRFTDGDAYNFKMDDISDAKILEKQNDRQRIAFVCKDDKFCIHSTGSTRQNMMRFSLQIAGNADPLPLFTLMSNLVKTYKNQTATNSAAVVSEKSGSLEDCKIILSDECRNFILQSNISDFLPILKGSYTKDGEFIANEFRAKYLPINGAIFSVEFSFNTKSSKQNKPGANIKWEESRENVEKKLGDAKGAEFYYGSKERLFSITLKRDKTESEIAAEINHEANLTAKQEADRIYYQEDDKKAEFLIQTYRYKLQKEGYEFVSQGITVADDIGGYPTKYETNLDKGYFYQFISVSKDDETVVAIPPLFNGANVQNFVKLSTELGFKKGVLTIGYAGNLSSANFTFQPKGKRVYWMLCRKR